MNRDTSRVIVALALAIGAGACSGQSPSAPGESPAPSGSLNVGSISPSAGSTVRPTPVTITGTGFLPGATVTIGGVGASVALVSSTAIQAVASARGPGPADVVVTNLGGLRGTLPAGFTYLFHEPFTITPSTDAVDAGSPMSVSWTAPAAHKGDWLAVFKVGGSFDDHDWWADTDGAESGSHTLTAPTRPGQYEFRYMLDGSFEEAARSPSFTVR